jgi:hypothetical protein
VPVGYVVYRYVEALVVFVEADGAVLGHVRYEHALVCEYLECWSITLLASSSASYRGARWRGGRKYYDVHYHDVV